jgi:hypothetical protein
MVEVQALPRRERLVMVFRGQVLEEELEHAGRDLWQALPRISPYFDMISYVSEAEALSPVAVERIRRMAELIVAAGLRTHVRVVGRSSQAALQFQRISRTVGYDSRLAYSFAEAERLLDGPG